MILDYVAIKLHEAFGYEIYKHEVEQGLIEPCFLISVIGYNKQQLLGSRSIRRLPLDILFFPSEGITQCYEVADRLMNELEIVGDNVNKFAGTEMNAEVIDGVLHFRVNYNAVVCVESTIEENMELLEQNNGVLNG